MEVLFWVLAIFGGMVVAGAALYGLFVLIVLYILSRAFR
jgi:hypothetical protein